MLSLRIAPRILNNAVACHLERRDVVIHNWIEACATVCALRVLITEEDEKKKNPATGNSSSTSIFDSYLRQVRMRHCIRDSLFRVHVPRTITPTQIGRDVWAPLKMSNSSSQQQHQQPPFSDEEFQRWIAVTTQQSQLIAASATAVGGDGYIPLPAFVSSFESLAKFKTMNAKQQNQHQVMGRKSTAEQLSRCSEDDFSPHALKRQAIHQTTMTEAEPYRRLLRFLDGSGSGSSNNSVSPKQQLEEDMARKRDIPENLARVMFRAAIVHGGGSADAQFALSLVRDHSVGDLLISDSCEAAPSQFGFAIRTCAKQGSGRSAAMRDVSSRARTFVSNSNSDNSSPSSPSCFPPLTLDKKTAVAAAKRPFSVRPGDEQSTTESSDAATSAATNENDFNLCVWTNPIEPLLPDPLLHPKMWCQMYRRDTSSSSSCAPPVAAATLIKEKMELSRQNERAGDYNDHLETIRLVTTPRAIDSLRDFDSELLRRMSNDVGGFVAVVAPCLVSRHEADRSDPQIIADAAAGALLPTFSSGRVGIFPSVVLVHQTPLAPIWRDQFVAAARKSTELRRTWLHLSARQVLEACFGGDAAASDASMRKLASDPFCFDYTDTGDQSPPLGACFNGFFRPLLDALQLDSSNAGGAAEPNLCLLLMRCPPGLTSPRLEEKVTRIADARENLNKINSNSSNNSNSVSGSKSSSNVFFTNTFEYDTYIPRSGAPAPGQHWSERLPTFSYLDEDHVARRKAELERRNAGSDPHPFSDVLFPPHNSRAVALLGSAGESPEDFSEVVDEGGDDDVAAAATTSTTTGDLVRHKLTPTERNNLKQSFGTDSAAAAAKKLREAQLRFGTVGAIFHSELKQKQLSKAAIRKQTSRAVDRHLHDERFFNERVLPTGHVAMQVHQELQRVGVRSPDQMDREKKKFGRARPLFTPGRQKPHEPMRTVPTNIARKEQPRE